MPGRTIVLHMQWAEGGLTRQETYGPWEVREDDSHLESITEFLKTWKRVLGCEPSSVTMAIVIDPQKVAGAEWTPEQIEEFRERWNAGHVPPR